MREKAATHEQVLDSTGGTPIASARDMNADRLAGALLGVAIGDALGLPVEGLSGTRVSRRFKPEAGYRLVGSAGFVSDDTEQSALLAQALASTNDDALRVRRFRRSMVGWFARLPFGIGGATLRSCVRMMLGMHRPGVRSAGNGAAMRAGILGVHLADDATRRRLLGRSIAELTHTDERAIQGALYVAEVAASQCRDADRVVSVSTASELVVEPELRRAIDAALEAADADQPLEDAALALGNTGFVVHSVALCTYCFLRFRRDPMDAIEAAIRAGGDTDTHAAIVGGWIGARHGPEAFPASLIEDLHDGPFGPTHLRGIARALATGGAPPTWSWPYALLRNLALYPVILAHGFARLAPW